MTIAILRKRIRSGRKGEERDLNGEVELLSNTDRDGTTSNKNIKGFAYASLSGELGEEFEIDENIERGMKKLDDDESTLNVPSGLGREDSSNLLIQTLTEVGEEN